MQRRHHPDFDHEPLLLDDVVPLDSVQHALFLVDAAHDEQPPVAHEAALCPVPLHLHAFELHPVVQLHIVHLHQIQVFHAVIATEHIDRILFGTVQ